MKATRLAGLIAGITAVLAFASPAGAIPPGDPEPPPIPELPRTYEIRGSITLVGCTASASTVHVTATGARTVRATATGGPTSFRYAMRGLEPGRYQVTPRLDPGVCPYGTWQPTQQTVTADFSTERPVSVASFTYTRPAHVTRIPASVAASVIDGALGDARLRLHNFGRRHGQSHHLPNGSTVSIAGRTSTFTIPDHQVDLDCGFFCPDLGQARFYVNDVNLDALGVRWASKAFQVDVGFESAGREVKGFYTNDTLGTVSDNLMPDVQIDDARLRLALVPVADGHGSITYRRQGSVSFDGSIRATGACTVFRVDICEPLIGYKGKIRSAVESPLASRLDSSSAKTAAAQAFRAALDRLGIGQVKAVFVESTSIVVTW